MKLICNVTRGQDIESTHDVYAVAISEDSKIIFQREIQKEKHLFDLH